MNRDTETGGPQVNLPYPIGFGQVLDRTFRLMRACWRTLMGVAWVPAAGIVAMILIMLPLYYSVFGAVIRGQSKAPNFGTFWLLFLVVPLLQLGQFFLFALYLPAGFWCALQAHRGIRVTIGEAYRASMQRYRTHLWTLTLISLYFLIPLIGCILAIVLLGLLLSWLLHDQFIRVLPFLTPLFFLLYIGIFVYFVFVVLRFSFAFLAGEDERIPARQALKRSAELTRGIRGRIFGVLIVIYLIVYAVMYACLIALMVVGVGIALFAVHAKVAVGSPAFFVLIGIGVFLYLVIFSIYTMASYASVTTALAVLYDHQKHLRNLSMPLVAPPENSA